MRSVLAWLAAALWIPGFLGTSVAVAQSSYPHKAVRVIYGYTGVSERPARLFAEK